MFERLPGRKKLLRSPARRPHLIGLVIAVLATAALLAAVLTGALPFVVITIVGFIATVLLIYFDLQAGERHRDPRTHQPKLPNPQVNQKQPDPPAQRL